MTIRALLVAPLCMALLAGHAIAQDNDDPVSRAEYEQLQQQLQELREQIGATREQALPREEADEYFDFLDAELRELGTRTAATEPGTSRFLVTGYASSGFTYRRGEETDFNLTLAPIFLWQVNDRIFFEAEPKFKLSGQGETDIELEYARASFLVNDYMTVGAGQFLTPFSIFNPRLHASWINKLPDAPLAFDHHGGLAPGSSLGAFVQGGIPLSEIQRLNYAAYISNGPRLITDGHHAGELGFDSWDNANRSLAFGGRIGYLPFPELEVGYSFMYAPRVDPSGFDQSVGAQLHAVDLSYVRDVEWLAGRIDLRTEWMLSDVDDATFMDHGTPIEFDNRRWGGYVQAAYRPSMAGNEILENLEFVYRYDIVDHPRDAISGVDTDRHTAGVNYWLGETSVFKTAFQQTNPSGESSEQAVLLEFAVGF